MKEHLRRTMMSAKRQIAHSEVKQESKRVKTENERDTLSKKLPVRRFDVVR